MALYLYKDRPTLVMRNCAIANKNLTIPANTENWQQQAYITFPKEALLYGAFPHAHYRGSSTQLWLQAPHGFKTLPLSRPHYPFNWPPAYMFTRPVRAAPASKLL